MAASTDDRPSLHHRGSRRRLTPGAWKILLVTIGLLGAAVNTGNNLVYLMFSLLVAALPVSLALGAFNLRRVRCELKLPAAARVGAPFTVEVEVAFEGAQVAGVRDSGDQGPRGSSEVAQPQLGQRAAEQQREEHDAQNPGRGRAHLGVPQLAAGLLLSFRLPS